MSDGKAIEVEGKIVTVLPGTMFRVQLDNGHMVLAHISGKLRKHFIKIAAGDKVAMYYTSANRDEAVFEDSQTFDIHRSPNPHLSFGIAEHFCLGVHLARLEGRVFFTELLAAFDEIELLGEPVRLRSNLNNSFKQLPVRLGGYRG